MRILVVDDSEDSRDLTEGMLLAAGYDGVVTAASGWEALKILNFGSTKEPNPDVDLVLLDIVMPEMDGIETCARIRNDPRYSNLPIVMVTSLEDMDSLSNAFVAGATDYVTKPVNRVELIARVRAAIRLKSELDRRLQREQELLTFLSDWGSRRADLWIDEPTGLFVGEIAEAYLMAANKHQQSDVISILAVMLDRFDTHHAAHSNAASHTVLGQVAHAMRMLIASVGIIAAAYPNGIIILVAPEFAANSARQFAESVRATVSKLRLPHPEADAFDHVTASVVAVTGNVQREVDRVHLLTQAISRVQDVSSSGGNRVLALTL